MESYSINATDQEMIPLSYKMLQKYKIIQQNFTWYVNTQSFHGAGSHNIELDTPNGKIYIPKTLFNNLIDWYQKYLMYPGETITEESITQNLY